MNRLSRLWFVFTLLLWLLAVEFGSSTSPYSITNKKNKPKTTTKTTTSTRRVFYEEDDEDEEDQIDDENYDDEKEFPSHPFTTAVHKQLTFTTSFNKMTPFISVENQPLNYCSFFNNRAPSPQINLKNCTWYKENSCCLQSEIESTFSKVKPLIGSSELCQQYINSLMCYICAPNQFKFYGKERLTVCREFCNKMYDACADAVLKGSKINEIYKNGEEFCKSRRYIVDDKHKDKCFYYTVVPRTNYARWTHELELLVYSINFISLFMLIT